jgi:MFS family permease
VKAFSISAALARLPQSMISLGIVLAINHIYGAWTSAGTLSAVFVLAAAVATPIFARLFDRYGQRRVGRVALPLSALSLAAFASGVLVALPLWILYVLAIAMGLTQFSFGALVRTRWARALRCDTSLSLEERRQALNSAYSFEAAIDELVYVIGPVFATFLATAVHPVSQLFVSLVAMIGGGTVFFALRSAVTVAPAVSVERVEVEATPPLKRSRRSPIALLRTMKTHTALGFPGMSLLILSLTVLSMSFSAYDVILVAMTKAAGEEYIVGVVMATFTGGSMVGALIYGARQWHGSLWMRYMLCLAVLALGFFSFSLVKSNLVALCIVQFIVGLFDSPAYATCSMIIENSVPGTYLTEGLSWLSTSSALGSSVGSALVGVLIDSRGVDAGFYIPWGSVLAALMIVLIFKSGVVRAAVRSGRRYR